jgi:sugar phosphate isomerase/epimerase
MPRRKTKDNHSFKVGVDSYSLRPLNLTPFELLDWMKINGGDGVQFSEGRLPPKLKLDKVFFRDLAVYAREKGLYLEWGGAQHVPFDLESGRPLDIFKINRRAAEQAHVLGLKAVRSCSGGLMRWTDEGLSTEVLLRSMAESLRAQKQMLEDFDVALAIETHFEFTTFELIRLFARCGAQPGGYLGVCLDTMNLLTMLEDPVAATRRVLPWIVMTHIKDGGILLRDEGLVSFPAEEGKGIIDLAAIIKLLQSLDRTIHLTLEDHGGEFQIPIFDREFLLKFPDLTVIELARLLGHANNAKKLVDRGELEIVDRNRWPDICENRVRRDIQNIKEIVRRMD